MPIEVVRGAAEHIKYGTDGCLGPGTLVDRSREDAFEAAKVGPNIVKVGQGQRLNVCAGYVTRFC